MKNNIIYAGKSFLNCVLITAILSAMILSACETSQGSAGPEASQIAAPFFSSLNEIPGITEKEIKAVQEMREQGVSFVFGTLQSTESFYNVHGEIRGFTALLCEWFSELFGIHFEPQFYEWDDLLLGLETGEIDFTGELTANEERRRTYFMTETIANRTISFISLVDSPPLTWIARSRPPRYAFLDGATTFDDVFEQSYIQFEAFFVDNYDEAYSMLDNGVIDAFFEEHTVEAAFEQYTDVVIENFFPLILSPVSLSTQNPVNKPVISIVQKNSRKRRVSFSYRAIQPWRI